MISLHFTGGLWWLLLLPAGGLFLWRQYFRRKDAAGGRGNAIALAVLQGAALLVLAVSLTGPEWRRHYEMFHDPLVLVLRDQSGSFRGGRYLGLGGAYAEAENAIARAYQARGFKLLYADFDQRADFAGAAGAGTGEGTALTSFAAAADFVDSAALPNLQAVFLFSDGRATLDSGRSGRPWRAPVYPVIFPPDSVAEAQPERAALSRDGREIELAWRAVGKISGRPRLTVLLDGRTVLNAELDVDSAAGGEIRTSRIPWTAKDFPAAGRTFSAVLRPAEPAANFDPYNDTVAVSAVASGRMRIRVLGPLRSLDEKAMMDALRGWDGAEVSVVSAEALRNEALSERDQIWAEIGKLGAAALAALPGRKAVYIRPGAQARAALEAFAAGAGIRWREFSLAAELLPGKNTEEFPDDATRVKNLSATALALPESAPPWRVDVAAAEGGFRGVLMGRLASAGGGEIFYFALPAAWPLLFDAQADFTARQNVAAYVRAAAALAARPGDSVRAFLPRRAYGGVPFDVEFRLPPAERGALSLTAAGAGVPRSLRLRAPDRENARAENVALAPGRYALELKAGGAVLWRESLAVAPKAALELARIGFDRAALAELAGRSGGAALTALRAGAGAGAQVTDMLPKLPGGQIRAERAESARLYNTRTGFFLVLALLAAAWLLRKKWDLD